MPSLFDRGSAAADRAGIGVQKEKPRSLLRQVTDLADPRTMAKGVGSLLWETGGLIAQTPGTLAAEAGRRLSGKSREEMAALAQSNPFLRATVHEGAWDAYQKPGDSLLGRMGATGDRLAPGGTAMVRSVESTPGEVVNLAAGLAPGGLKPSETNLAQASREGRVADYLLEHGGNILMGLGAAGTAAGRVGQGAAARAGLGEAARTAGGVETAAGFHRPLSRAAFAEGRPLQVMPKPTLTPEVLMGTPSGRASLSATGRAADIGGTTSGYSAAKIAEAEQIARSARTIDGIPPRTVAKALDAVKDGTATADQAAIAQQATNKALQNLLPTERVPTTRPLIEQVKADPNLTPTARRALLGQFRGQRLRNVANAGDMATFMPAYPARAARRLGQLGYDLLPEGTQAAITDAGRAAQARLAKIGHGTAGRQAMEAADSAQDPLTVASSAGIAIRKVIEPRLESAGVGFGDWLLHESGRGAALRRVWGELDEPARRAQYADLMEGRVEGYTFDEFSRAVERDWTPEQLDAMDAARQVWDERVTGPLGESVVEGVGRDVTGRLTPEEAAEQARLRGENVYGDAPLESLIERDDRVTRLQRTQQQLEGRQEKARERMLRAEQRRLLTDAEQQEMAAHPARFIQDQRDIARVAADRLWQDPQVDTSMYAGPDAVARQLLNGDKTLAAAAEQAGLRVAPVGATSRAHLAGFEREAGQAAVTEDVARQADAALGTAESRAATAERAAERADQAAPVVRGRQDVERVRRRVEAVRRARDAEERVLERVRTRKVTPRKVADAARDRIRRAVDRDPSKSRRRLRPETDEQAKARLYEGRVERNRATLERLERENPSQGLHDASTVPDLYVTGDGFPYDNGIDQIQQVYVDALEKAFGGEVDWRLLGGMKRRSGKGRSAGAHNAANVVVVPKAVQDWLATPEIRRGPRPKVRVKVSPNRWETVDWFDHHPGAYERLVRTGGDAENVASDVVADLGVDITGAGAGDAAAAARVAAADDWARGVAHDELVRRAGGKDPSAVRRLLEDGVIDYDEAASLTLWNRKGAVHSKADTARLEALVDQDAVVGSVDAVADGFGEVLRRLREEDAMPLNPVELARLIDENPNAAYDALLHRYNTIRGTGELAGSELALDVDRLNRYSSAGADGVWAEAGDRMLAKINEAYGDTALDLLSDVYEDNLARRALQGADAAPSTLSTWANDMLAADEAHLRGNRGEAALIGEADRLDAATNRTFQQGRTTGRAEGTAAGRAAEAQGRSAQLEQRLGSRKARDVEGAAEQAQTRLAAQAQKQAQLITKREQQYQKARAEYAKVTRQLESTNVKLAETMDRLANSPEFVPARFRPAFNDYLGANDWLLRKAEELVQSGDEADAALASHYQAIAQEQGRTFEAFLGQLEKDPMFVPGIRQVESKPGVARRGGAKTGRLADQGIKKGTATASTPAGAIHAILDRAQTASHNEFLRAVIDQLGEGKPPQQRKVWRLEDIVADANIDPALAGPELLSAVNDWSMRRFGYEVQAWDPEATIGQGRRGVFALDAAEVNPQSLFVESDLFDALQAETKVWQSGLNWTDPAVSLWKSAILPLNPGWHIGNVTGAYVMAAMNGIDVVDFHREINYWRKIVKAADEGDPEAYAMIAPEYRNVGMDPLVARERSRTTWDRSTSPDELGGRRPQNTNREQFASESGRLGRLRGVIQKSYDANERFDVAAKLALDSLVKAAGGSDELAVQTALRAMPNFHLSGFERGVARRWAPFYVWQKHLTKAALRLPVSDPARIAWLAYMEQHWLTDEQRSPDAPFMKGMFELGGGRFLPMGTFMPYNAVASLPTDPRNLGKFVNPVVQGGLAGVFGLDPRQQNKPLSYAQGSRWYTPYGQEAPRPLLTMPSGAVNYLANMSPLTRPINEAIRGQGVARYDSGEAVTRQGRPLRDDDTPMLGGRLGSLERAAGHLLPLPSNIDVEQQRREKRARDRRK